METSLNERVHDIAWCVHKCVMCSCTLPHALHSHLCAMFCVTCIVHPNVPYSPSLHSCAVHLAGVNSRRLLRFRQEGRRRVPGCSRRSCRSSTTCCCACLSLAIAASARRACSAGSCTLHWHLSLTTACSYVDDEFYASYAATIGIDFKVKNMVIDGRRVRVQIW